MNYGELDCVLGHVFPRREYADEIGGFRIPDLSQHSSVTVHHRSSFAVVDRSLRMMDRLVQSLLLQSS